MRIIGLCGSTSEDRDDVALRLRNTHLVPTINVERASNLVTAKGSAAYDKIIEEFGTECLSADLSINKKELISSLYGTEKLETLKSIISESIKDMMEGSLNKLDDAGHKIVVINYGNVPHDGYDEQIVISDELPAKDTWLWLKSVDISEIDKLWKEEVA